MRLKIAAKIEGDDDRYYREEIKPLLGSDVEFLGEVDEPSKAELLSNAAALLFPIDWPEPFGLVVIEAMAFGVPIVAWREGAMPEIIDEGETGFVVDSIEAAVLALAKCAALDRRSCPASLRTPLFGRAHGLELRGDLSRVDRAGKD